MTVTLSPEQLAEDTGVDNETESVKTPQRRADVRELAALLAQAYAGMPLFP